MEKQGKVKTHTKYSSSILKFKLKKKIIQNGVATTISNGRITSLDSLANEYKKAKSMMDIRPITTQNLDKKHDLMEIMPDEEAANNLQEMDSLFAGSSNSSVSSLLEDQSENYYQNSVIECSSVKDPEQLIDKDLINLLSFVKKLKIPPESVLEDRKIEFGEYTRHKTLVWDLDETLIHAQLVLPGQVNHLSDFVITLKNGARFAVTIRPYVYKCLEYLQNYYEMAIFTAAEQEYADLILDQLDPEKSIFCKRMYRQHCTKVDDVYVKDLRIISDRDLQDIIIVDNSILSFAFQINNGIPICAFFSQNKQQDQEMLYLITYLEEIFGRKDSREVNTQTFKLEELINKIE